MNYVTEMLNNREIAILIWLSIFFIWALSKRDIRSSLYKVLKALFVKKIILSIIYMLLYVSLMVLAFYVIGFWDKSAIKDTILWTLGVAFIMLVNSNKASSDEHYFRKIALDNIKLVLILEFVINLFTFSLVTELIIMPILTIAVAMKAVAELKPEHKQVEAILCNALSIFGSIIILFVFYKVIIDFKNFATIGNLRNFLLPPVFTFAFLPFVYLMALFMKYENIFDRIDMFNKDTKLASYAKRKIITAYHFNLKKLNEWSKEIGILRFSSEEDILSSIQKNKGN